MQCAMQEALEAISHPGRRQMLLLVMNQELQAGDIADLTGMKQPAASQHLRVLREAGLVEVRVDGPRRMYRINFAGLHALRSELEEFWSHGLEALRRSTEGDR
jgi:DNA-binding transcriptional ArsR family regulator